MPRRAHSITHSATHHSPSDRRVDQEWERTAQRDGRPAAARFVARTESVKLRTRTSSGRQPTGRGFAFFKALESLPTSVVRDGATSTTRAAASEIVLISELSEDMARALASALCFLSLQVGYFQTVPPALNCPDAHADDDPLRPGRPPRSPSNQQACQPLLRRWSYPPLPFARNLKVRPALESLPVAVGRCAI